MVSVSPGHTCDLGRSGTADGGTPVECLRGSGVTPAVAFLFLAFSATAVQSRHPPASISAKWLPPEGEYPEHRAMRSIPSAAP